MLSMSSDEMLDIEIRNKIIPLLTKEQIKSVYGDPSNHGKTVWIAYAYGKICGVWSTKAMAYNAVGEDYPIMPYVLDDTDKTEFGMLMDLEDKIVRESGSQ